MPRWFVALALLVATALPAFAQLAPDKALASMKAGDGLQVELFAHEPMLVNPTSIDVDDKGRVWVAEAVNYRRKNFNRPILREEGDRIVVLVDEKGEGKASKSVVFYQGKELYGPLSVCVIPVANPDRKGGGSYRVLVAQSPDILEFTCKDATNPVADGPPKKFLTGFGGFDHDHGVHGLHLGPDGKLYFTVGDQGVKGLQSADGKGRKFTSNTTDIQGGTVWRCDLDGNNLELIAHNFRNNYEACVDSFGEIWLSDNDDDGNQQTRICHVMPGGNYGYFPRGAGQSHWHEEQPGVVHKTLRTGFGSPTGIQFYEGALLPKQYQNTILHTDAGPRELRAFTRKPKGAGYELDKALMLTSTDTWFRPSDVCTAPDGSVFVADWYDPGVGGHGMGDWTRGRIFRITPTGHKGYTVPEVKLETKEGVLVALGSPCPSVRSAAIQAHKHMDKEQVGTAYKAVSQKLWDDRGLQARALWAIASIDIFPRKDVVIFASQDVSGLFDGVYSLTAYRMAEAFSGPGGDYDPRLLMRTKKSQEADPLPIIKTPDGWESPKPSSAAEAREQLLLTRRTTDLEKAKVVVYTRAREYDGQDIFYRAALNIACGTDPKRRDAILADFDRHFPEWNDKVADLVWELRPKSMLPKLEKSMTDAKLTAAQKARIVDILASSDDAGAGKVMLTLLKGQQSPEVKARAVENLKLFLPTKWKDLGKSDEVREAFSALLADKGTQLCALQLAAAAPDCANTDDIAALAMKADADRTVRTESVKVLGKLKHVKFYRMLEPMVTDAVVGPAAVSAIGEYVGGNGVNSGAAESLAFLRDLVSGDKAVELRKAAVAALAGSRIGTGALLKLKEDGKFPEPLAADAGRLLRNSPFAGERNKALQLFPAPGKLDPKKLPPIAELVKRTGNADNGKSILAKSVKSDVQCMKCHMVRGQGGQIGPDLSMIGKKASRENLYESILLPSKAVADQYVSWKVDTDDGQSVVGLLVGETETNLTLRDANGKDYTFPVKGTERKKQLQSIMPEGLIATLTEDELVDLVEYLTKLQTPSLTPEWWHVAGPFPVATERPLDVEFGPEKGVFDVAAKFKSGGKEVAWRTVRAGGNGYVDLAAFLGKESVHSVSVLTRNVESPTDQEVTILLGTDDGCRLSVNGNEVFKHDRDEAAAPERDRVTVKLKKGVNAMMLKINNGNDPHGFYLTIEGGTDLKLAK